MGLRELFKKAEAEKESRLIVLVDYENVGKEVISARQVIDLNKVRDECLKIGTIELAAAFVPEHLVYDGLTDYLHDRNYKLIACPSKNRKQKDKVDSIMTEVGNTCADLMPSITHIVIVAMDGDFTDLANHAKDHRKKTIAFASEFISSSLRRIVDEILPLPLKNLELPEDKTLMNLPSPKGKNGKH